MFYIVIRYWEGDIAGIFSMHFVSNNIMLANLYLYIIYLRNLMLLPQRTNLIIARSAGFIVIVGVFLDSVSQITHFGFYRNEDGLWFNPRFFNPFTITYFVCLLYILILFIVFRNRLITQVRRTFIFLGTLCSIIVIIQNVLGNDSYIVFTYLLPVIGVFVMIHSHPYELSTGALGTGALKDYIEGATRRDENMSFLTIRFKLGRGMDELPESFGKAIHEFWRTNYKQARLFKVQGDTYILAIEEKYSRKDPAAMLEYFRYLIVEVFPKYYEEFKIPYKIMAFEPSHYMQTATDFLSAVMYYDNRIPDNTYVFVNDEEYKKLARVRYILNQLDDICKKLDKNDPRIFVYAQPVKEVSTGKFTTAVSG